jgi:hypothetical protein
MKVSTRATGILLFGIEILEGVEHDLLVMDGTVFPFAILVLMGVLKSVGDAQHSHPCDAQHSHPCDAQHSHPRAAQHDSRPCIQARAALWSVGAVAFSNVIFPNCALVRSDFLWQRKQRLRPVFVRNCFFCFFVFFGRLFLLCGLVFSSTFC